MSEQKKRGMHVVLRISEYWYEIINWVAAILELFWLSYSAINPILDHAMSERTKRGMWSSLRISEY